MDRRSILAIAICFLFLAVWQTFFVEPPAVKQPPPPQTVATQTTRSESTEAVVKESKPIPSQVVTEALDLKGSTVLVSDQAKTLFDWNLHEYQYENSNGSSHAVDLASVIRHRGAIELLFDR